MLCGGAARPGERRLGSTRRERLEDVRPDVDLDRRRGDQHRDRQGDGDEGGGEELVPLAAAAGDQPGGERQEERGQLGQRVREDAEDQLAAGDVELVGDRRALETEVERLGAEREEGHRGDEEDRQLARLDVDPAREAGPLGGGDRHRGAGDEAGDAGGRVQRQDQRVAPEDRQQVVRAPRAR